MHLFTITISTLNQQGNVRLLFSDEARALAAWQRIFGNTEGTSAAARVTVDDDYGNFASLRRDVLAHVVMTDMTKGVQGEQDMAIFNAHAQIALQKRADSDQAISGAAKANQLRANLMNGSARQ